MAQFRTCPDCGAHLDPNEQCDCQTDAVKEDYSAVCSRDDDKDPLCPMCIRFLFPLGCMVEEEKSCSTCEGNNDPASCPAFCGDNSLTYTGWTPKQTRKSA